MTCPGRCPFNRALTLYDLDWNTPVTPEEQRRNQGNYDADGHQQDRTATDHRPDDLVVLFKLHVRLLYPWNSPGRAAPTLRYGTMHKAHRT